MTGPIIDGHLDLAWNALSFDRDLTQSIACLRQRETAMQGPGRGRGTVSLPEMRRGGVVGCFASLLARVNPARCHTTDPLRTDIDYADQDAAYAVAQGQLAYYRLLEDRGELRIIADVRTLDAWWADRVGPRATGDQAIGVVLSMEGADPIVDPDQVGQWWDQGLRAVGLAHYGPGVYAHGTPGDLGHVGGLTDRGRRLLAQLEAIGMMLDLTHTSDAAFSEAIDLYGGPVFASHTNCRALAPGPRQFSDAQLKILIQRGGVIGCALHISMLRTDAAGPRHAREAVGLRHAADHIDHICQLAGDVGHTAIGSDLDGGFGWEHCPRDVDTIADVGQLAVILSSRGYGDSDIAALFHGNWLGLLHRALPEA